MIQLNGVTLDENLLWANEFDNAGIAQSVSRTILGNLVLQQMPIIKGKQINLVATSTGDSYSGSFTREQIIAFKALEEAGTTVVLNYEGTSYNVVVMSGGVQVAPLIARPNQAIDDLYTGTLILIEV